MKGKYGIALTCLILSAALVFSAGCTATVGASPSPSKTPGTSPTASPAASAGVSASPSGSPAGNVSGSPAASPDVVTTASIVDTESAFLNAISSKGTWIICLLKDLTTDQDLVLEGEFKNGKKDTAGKEIIQRKVALYSQDENRTITARYTLTAPKMTIRSPQASIQHGTFVGDLYVETNDFQLIDTTVQGNVYFTDDAAKAGFKMDDKSKVTGKQEVKK